MSLNTTANAGSAGAFHLLRTAVFFGLATGFVEAAIIVFRQFILHRFVWTPPFHVWAAPAIYALVFLVVGLPILLLRIAGWQRAERVAPYVYGFLGAWILTLPFPQLGRLAPVILALGVATQIGRNVNSHFAGFGRVVRYGTWGMVCLIVALATGMPITESAVERWRMSRLGSARAGAPNVLLIILDTVRATSFGLYGNPLPTTPNLERRASQGVVFDRAITPSSWTLPAHASLFTGRWVHELKVDYRKPLDGAQPTLAEVMRDDGYATGGFVGNDRYTFKDAGLYRGFIRYDDYMFTRKEVLRSPVLMQTTFFRGLAAVRDVRNVLWRFKEFDFRIPEARWGQRKNADVVNRNFLAWASQLKGRPFFAFLNYYDAHHEHRCPPPFRARFNCKASQENAYHGSIAYLDSELEQLFQELDRRGLLHNTVVIVTSDHGEQFGEHGLNGHGNSLYMPLLHVPLIVWGPGVASGIRVAAPVSVRDIAATVLDVSRLPVSARKVPGSSLAPYWQTIAQASGTGADTTPLYSQIISAPFRSKEKAGGNARISVVRADRHYILSEGGREELYDYWTDRAEARDLKGSAAEKTTLNWARRTLTPIAKAQGAQPSDTPGGAHGVASR